MTAACLGPIADDCQLVAGLGRGKKLYVVCFELGVKKALSKATSAEVLMVNAKQLPPAKAGDVQLVITPVRLEGWMRDRFRVVSTAREHILWTTPAVPQRQRSSP